MERMLVILKNVSSINLYDDRISLTSKWVGASVREKCLRILSEDAKEV